MTDENENEDSTMSMAGSPECVAEAMKTLHTGREPDFTVVAARLGDTWDHEKSKGFIIVWETVSAGFGELTFRVDKEGTLSCDLEGMGKKFTRDVFNKFVESI